MQRLYETHKILTYPRTDSRYLTTDIVGTLKERLEACAVGPWRKTAALLARQEIRPSGSFVNNAKVSDHHAIIPTEEYVRLDTLSSDERKIYDMVVRRFLAVLSPACETEEISVTGTIGQERFTAKGSIIRKAGWRQVYDSDWQDMDEEEDEFSGQDTFGRSGSTQIPGRGCLCSAPRVCAACHGADHDQRSHKTAGIFYRGHPGSRNGKSGKISEE